MSTRILLSHDELKCHSLCSKYPLFTLTQMWICISRPQHSLPIHYLTSAVIELNLVYE